MSAGLRLNLLSIFKNDFQIRYICTTRQLLTVYDPSKFCEPIVKMEELNKPLAPEDPRKFKYMTSMKSDQPPFFYRDHVIDKIVRVMMKEGKKELIRTEVYAALELIKRIQYKKWMQEKDEEKRKKIILDPIEIANLAIFNCRPVMQLKKIVKVGIIYQVPHPINEEHSIFRAIKMMRDILREKCKHGKNKFRVILANELINAMNNEGFTIQAKQELHRLCEANRAYSSFKKF